jgi:hypothetical protein
MIVVRSKVFFRKEQVIIVHLYYRNMLYRDVIELFYSGFQKGGTNYSDHLM